MTKNREEGMEPVCIKISGFWRVHTGFGAIRHKAEFKINLNAQKEGCVFAQNWDMRSQGAVKWPGTNEFLPEKQCVVCVFLLPKAPEQMDSKDFLSAIYFIRDPGQTFRLGMFPVIPLLPTAWRCTWVSPSFLFS